MMYAAHFTVAILACFLTARLLTHPGWPGLDWGSRSPRAAIICWQALGLAAGLSLIGVPLALGLAPYDAPTGAALRRFAGDLLAGTLPAEIGPARLALIALGLLVAGALLGTTIRNAVSTIRAQRRHRELLALVARNDPAAPGALVLDHPRAAAYCLPGVRPQVVVSAGTLDLLDRAELAAVLSHERAHAHERHDLVLLPFSGLCRALPRARWIRAAHDRVALLVEMRADDRARRRHPEALAAALRRFAAIAGQGTPAGALGLADTELDARLHRLLVPGRPPWFRATVALGIAAALVAMPLSLFLS